MLFLRHSFFSFSFIRELKRERARKEKKLILALFHLPTVCTYLVRIIIGYMLEACFRDR